MMTRHQLADAVDDLDEQIAALNAAKSDTYKAYKADLLATGMTGQRASAELSATKAAIAKRQKLASDKGEDVRERDDLIDDILDEIMRPSRAREAAVPAKVVVTTAASVQAESARSALDAALDVIIEADEASEAHDNAATPSPPATLTSEPAEALVTHAAPPAAGSGDVYDRNGAELGTEDDGGVGVGGTGPASPAYGAEPSSPSPLDDDEGVLEMHSPSADEPGYRAPLSLSAEIVAGRPEDTISVRFSDGIVRRVPFAEAQAAWARGEKPRLPA